MGPLSRHHVNEMNFAFGSKLTVLCSSASGVLLSCRKGQMVKRATLRALATKCGYGSQICSIIS